MSLGISNSKETKKSLSNGFVLCAEHKDIPLCTQVVVVS